MTDTTAPNLGRDLEPTLTLDARGLFCPEPVMLLHSHIKKIASGEALKIIATDPSTQRDVPKFCLFLGHELVHESMVDNQYEYLVRRK